MNKHAHKNKQTNKKKWMSEERTKWRKIGKQRKKKRKGEKKLEETHTKRKRKEGKDKKKTRPDTRQSSRGRLGRSSNAKTARNSKMLRTDRPTDLPTDMARCRVACPRLKIRGRWRTRKTWERNRNKNVRSWKKRGGKWKGVQITVG